MPDYKPDLEPYVTMSSFKAWCQRVIPGVYDGSISVYEMLCKLTAYLNTLISNVDGQQTDIENLLKAYSQLEDYVNNYFSSTDFQQLVNDKLNDMAESGELTELMEPFFSQLQTQIENFNLTGKHAYFFGDSLMWGLLTAGGQSVNNIPATFHRLTNAIVHNQAVSGAVAYTGSKTRPPMIDQLDNLDMSNADYVFFNIGTNDWADYSPIGDIFTSESFMGCIANFITTVYSKVPAKCKVFMIPGLPTVNLFGHTQNYLTAEYETYVDACERVAKEYDLSMLDLIHGSGINANNYQVVSGANLNVHFTDTGYLMLGTALAYAVGTGLSYTGKTATHENMLKGDMFRSNFSLYEHFQSTGFSDIMIDYKSRTWSLNEPLFMINGETYHLSADIYNGYSGEPQNLYFSFGQNIGSDQTVSVFYREFVPVGNHHVETTFTFKGATGFWDFYAGYLNIPDGIFDAACTNLALVKGDSPFVCANYAPRNASYSASYISGVSEALYENQQVLVRAFNGIAYISGQMKVLVARNPSQPVLEFESLRFPVENVQPSPVFYTLGWANNSTDGLRPVLLALSGNQLIVSYGSIKANDSLVIASVFPFGAKSIFQN